MSESPENREQRELREFEAKNVAHYSVLLQAWVDTRMERDRTIVTLSAAAIGLLTTILTTIGVSNSVQIYLYGGAFIGFLVATLISLSIYRRNSDHIERVIHDSSTQDPQLVKYDKIQIAAFMVGAAFAASIGIHSAIVGLNGDTKVNDKTKTHQPAGLANDSLHGINRLAPEGLKKSLDGITALAPKAPVQPQAATSAQSQTQSGTTTQPTTGATSQTGESK